MTTIRTSDQVNHGSPRIGDTMHRRSDLAAYATIVAVRPVGKPYRKMRPGGYGYAMYQNWDVDLVDGVPEVATRPCHNCGSQMHEQHGTYRFNAPAGKTLVVERADWLECDNCGEQMLPAKLDLTLERMVA